MGFLYSINKTQTHNVALLYKQMLQQNVSAKIYKDECRFALRQS